MKSSKCPSSEAKDKVMRNLLKELSMPSKPKKDKPGIAPPKLKQDKHKKHRSGKKTIPIKKHRNDFFPPLRILWIAR